MFVFDNDILAELAAGVFLLLAGIQFLTKADPVGKSILLLKHFRKQEAEMKSVNKTVESGIDNYNGLHHNESVESRSQQYKTLVDTYYDLVTLFFEWGWGDSFHFAYMLQDESFYDAIRRHEFALVSKIGLNKPNMKILDVGCGIGGPLKPIVRFTQSDVTGITINHYQVERGNELCEADPVVRGKGRLVQGDFMDMPFPSDKFDAAYAIEATCHAPDRLPVFKETFRVLKPGSLFASYEWCMTDKYIKGDPEHERIKKMIEAGDGLPELIDTSVCVNAMKEAGFEILETRDLANDNYGYGRPWYHPLIPSWNPLTHRFQFTVIGYQMVNHCVRFLEFIGLAPKGSYKTQTMLTSGAWALKEGGEKKIFTPMFLIVGRVPEKKKSE